MLNNERHERLKVFLQALGGTVLIVGGITSAMMGERYTYATQLSVKVGGWSLIFFGICSTMIGFFIPFIFNKLTSSDENNNVIDHESPRLQP